MSSRSLNKVMLIGNLTRDPVLKYTPKNTAVCSFGIATNRSWTTGEGGEKREETDFHNLVAWSKLAEVIGQHLHKGDKIYAEGRLQTRKWQDKEGQDRYTTEVVVDSMIILSPKAGATQVVADDGGMVADDAGMAPADDSSADPSSSSKSSKKNHKKTETVTDQVMAVEDVADDIPF